MIICCAAVCGARDELQGRGVVDANVCGVADEAGGGYGECGDIRLFFHRSKNTHLLLSVSRTKAVGKDGGYGQRERNVSLLGEVAEDDGGAKWGETTTTKEVWGAIAATTKIARGRLILI